MIAREIPSIPLIFIVRTCSTRRWSFLKDGSPASTTRARAHDLDESRQSEGDVHLRDARVVKRPHRVVSDHSFSGGEGLQAGDRKVVDRSIGRRDLCDFGDRVPNDVLIAKFPQPTECGVDPDAFRERHVFESGDVTIQGRATYSLTRREVPDVPKGEAQGLGNVGEDVAEPTDEVEGVVCIAALPGAAQSIQLSPLLPRFETHAVTEGARISRGNPQGEQSALPSLVRKDPKAGQEQTKAVDEFLRIRAGADDPSRYGDVPITLEVGSEKGSHARVARGEDEVRNDLRVRSASACSAKEIGQDHRSKVKVVPSREAPIVVVFGVPDSVGVGNGARTAKEPLVRVRNIDIVGGSPALGKVCSEQPSK